MFGPVLEISAAKGPVPVTAGEFADAIEAFWLEWPQLRKDIEKELTAGDYGSGTDRLTDLVEAIDPGLEWDLMPGMDARHALCLSAASDPALRPVTEQWLRRSPGPGSAWEYHAARIPVPAAPLTVGEIRIHPQDVSVKDLRVAFYTDNGIKSPSPDTTSTVRTAVSVLADHGVSVTENRPQGVSDAERLWYSLYLADGGAWIRRLIHAAGTERLSSALDWMQTAQPVSLTEFTQEMSRWNVYRSEMLAFMESYDVLLCPVSATPATRHDDPDGPDFTYTFAHNLTGWPGAVVRCGMSAEGLPIGVQIVAHPWREDVALAVAQYLETNLGGWQSPSL